MDDHTVARDLTRAARRPAIASITVVSDDRWWAENLAAALREESFAVTIDAAGDQGYDHRSRTADAVIVDHRLQSRPATAVCMSWRRQRGIPILVLSETTDEAAVLAAFAAGADHVLTVSISHRELVAWLRAAFRRCPPRRDVGGARPRAELPVRLGPDGRSALIGNRVVAVGPREFEILALLLSRAGLVVTRAELSDALVLTSADGRAIDSFVRRLREKLESADPVRRIRVVRGVGFTFALGDGFEEPE